MFESGKVIFRFSFAAVLSVTVASAWTVTLVSTCALASFRRKATFGAGAAQPFGHLERKSDPVLRQTSKAACFCASDLRLAAD